MDPKEVIAAPVDLWIAPVGEPYPLIDAVPGGNWALVGTDGDLNYDESGVRVGHPQTISTWTPLGSTGKRKAWRTEEGVEIDLTLVDMNLEQYAHVLNQNAVTDTAAGSGTAGFRKIPLHRGLTVVTRALLIRGLSPYDETMPLQYEIPRAFENSSPEALYQKGTPVGFALQWVAMEDLNASTPDERFGHIVAQDAAALP